MGGNIEEDRYREVDAKTTAKGGVEGEMGRRVEGERLIQTVLV